MKNLALYFGELLLASCSKNNSSSLATPNAQFSYTSSRTLPFAVQFINESVSSGAGTTYAWDFNDGIFSDSEPDSFTHYYVVQANYHPKLIQTDAAGNHDTATVQLNLMGTTGPSGTSARTAAAAFRYHITPYYTTVFTNTSTNATSYEWDFGDGTTSSSANATVSKDFEAPGTYHVKLKAISGTVVDSSEAIIQFN